MPWQVAQLAAKSLPPSSASFALKVVVEAFASLTVVATAYSPPVMRRPISSRAIAASGCRRFCESAFTWWFLYSILGGLREPLPEILPLVEKESKLAT
jgi:hypothetical protein